VVDVAGAADVVAVVVEIVVNRPAGVPCPLD
jgi:hypothetical protein